MKKLLILCFLLCAFSSVSFAADEPSTTDFYVLGTGGIIPYTNTTLESANTLWGAGATAGVQFNNYFAMEFGFLYSYLYGDSADIAGETLKVDLASFDYKLYFLYQQKFKVSDSVIIMPSIGMAPMFSQIEANASFAGFSDSITDDVFGLGFKAGARFKINYFLCGINLEYTKRFSSSTIGNADSLALMFEAGVMF